MKRPVLNSPQTLIPYAAVVLLLDFQRTHCILLDAIDGMDDGDRQRGQPAREKATECLPIGPIISRVLQAGDASR